MNDLEKLYALLNKNDRVVKYGEMQSETTDLLITIKAGESIADAAHFNHTVPCATNTVSVMVYAADYMTGFTLNEQLKQDILSSHFDNVKFCLLSNLESAYKIEKQRYQFQTNYKVLK